MAKRVKHTKRFPKLEGLQPDEIKRLVLDPKLGKRKDFTSYELALVEQGLIPKTFLLRHAHEDNVDKAIAHMLALDLIDHLYEREDGTELIRRKVRDLRDGRYSTNLSPEQFRLRNPGTRPEFSCVILHSDYRYLYELGKGRLTTGLQTALRKLREYEDGR